MIVPCPILNSLGEVFQGHTPGSLAPFLVRISFLGGIVFLSGAALCVYARGKKKMAAHLAALLVLTSLLGTIMQWIFHMSAPPESVRIVETSLYTFPDLHAARITAFSIFLCHFFSVRWLRYASLASVALVSLSRIYAGAANTHDIIGGIVLGILSVWLLSRAIRFLANRGAEPEKKEVLLFHVALYVSIFGLLKIFIPDLNGGADLLGIPGGILLGHILSGGTDLSCSTEAASLWRRGRAALGAIVILAAGGYGIFRLGGSSYCHPVPGDALILVTGLFTGALCAGVINRMLPCPAAAGNAQ